ncbi:MAG: glycosyltransferase family 39 protein [Anaerolineae bacterium]|nr:glycosyltransferase family 39 protein [Anaerolineae bacterium]
MLTHHHYQRAPVLLPAFVVLIGLLLRLALLGVDVRFHPDEALFAAQARLVSHEGDWLLRTTDLDKPPLTFYTTALSFRLLGPTEFAARLPNVLFSAVSIAVLIALARSLYGDPLLAVLAGLLLALSPYDLAFAATVFTDVQATGWTLIAALCAVRDRWQLAGIAAALIFATKPNALLFLPLIIALGIAHNATSNWRWRDVVWRLWRMAWPFALGIGIVVLWDVGRAPRSFLELGAQRNKPGRWIRADEVGPRLEQWGHWLGFITGSRLVNGFAVVGGGIGLVSRLRQRTRATVTDWLIVGAGMGWLAGHWLIAFNTYDRYVHTLVPFAVLLIARVIKAASPPGPLSIPNGEGEIARDFQVPLSNSVGEGDLGGEANHGIDLTLTHIGQKIRHLLPLMIIALILPHTITALYGDLPLGGDQDQHTGIDDLAAYLNTNLSGAIVYDHGLGWELAYYLGRDPQIHLLYHALPEALADDMRAQTATRYFVAPSPEAAAPWLDALRRVEITITPVYHAEFVIYALKP